MATGELPTDPTSGSQGPAGRGADDATAEIAVSVLLYSDDPAVRQQVRMALGPRPTRELRVDYLDCSTADAVIEAVDEGGIDLAILDGEATPTGGMGICRQLKNEVRRCPPILLLTGRRDDRWLATWSQADAAVPHPLDALELTEAVVTLLPRAGDRPGPVIRTPRAQR